MLGGPNGCAGADMAGLDDIIHQPLRLRIWRR